MNSYPKTVVYFTDNFTLSVCESQYAYVQEESESPVRVFLVDSKIRPLLQYRGWHSLSHENYASQKSRAVIGWFL